MKIFKYILLIVSLFTSIKFYGESSLALLEAGIDDYKKGQYSFAVNNLRKFIQFSDDSHSTAKALYYLSLSYYYEENYKISLSYLNELGTKYRMSEYTVQTYFWKGLIYQNLKMWREGEESFLRYVSVMAQSDIADRALLAAANCQMEQNEFDKAKSTLERLLGKYKNSEKFEEASVLYSYILFTIGLYGEAEKFLSQWVERLGKTGDNFKYKDRFWLYMGEIALKNNEFTYARLLFKNIDIYAKNSPSSDIALLRLFEIEKKLENFKEARNYLIRLKNEFINSKYSIDASLAMGILDYENNQYSDAVIFFTEAINSVQSKLNVEKDKKEKDRLEKLLSDARFYLAETFFSTEQIDKSKHMFSKIISENSFHKSKALLRLIEMFLINNNINEAYQIVQNYDNILSNDTDLSDQYHLYKSRILFSLKKFELSLKSIADVSTNSKYSVSAAKLKSKILTAQNNIDNAIKTLIETIDITQLNEKAEISYEIMVLYYTKKDYDKVIIYKNFVDTYLKYLDESKISDIKIKSNYLSGIANLELRKYKEAENQMSFVINLKSGDLSKDLKSLINRCYYYLGWIKYKQSEYLGAANSFAMAGELIDDDKLKKDAYYMEAWSYFSKKSYTDSIEKFSNIYNNYYPELIGIKAYFQTAKIYQNIGKTELAYSFFKKIVEEFPENNYMDDSLFELLKYNLNNNQIEDANVLLNIFRAKYPTSPFYSRSLLLQAETFLVEMRYSEALSTYNYYIDKYNTEDSIDEAYYWGGYSAYKTKDYETAEELLTKLVGKYKESKFYLDSLRLLGEVYKINGDNTKEYDVVLELTNIEKEEDKIKEYKERLKIIQKIKEGMKQQEAELVLSYQNGDNKSGFELGRYYYENNNDKGLEILIEIADKDQDDAGAKSNNYITSIKFYNDEYDQALRGFVKTINSYKAEPDTVAEALYKMAYCYYKLNSSNNSLKIIQRLEDNFKDSKWMLKALDLKRRMTQ